jgi:nucleotide-binding universal stress UspA family protein
MSLYKRILVPVDGSRTSNRGLREALKLAAGHRARLRVIHVVDVFLAAQNSVYADAGAGDMLDALTASGQRAIKNARALAERHGVRAEAMLFKMPGGRVGDFIVREAKRWGADVIVMGTHGRRGFSHLVLGSDAETVVKSSTIPVLLVRGKPPARR